MNKLWVALFLYCTAVSLSFAEKKDLQLQWREEQPHEKADFALKWREEPAKKNLQKEETNQREPLHEKRPWPSDTGRIHRSDRQRFIDPNFSAFNSDDSHSSIEWHSGNH